jgi:hypothetical protein
MLSHDHRDSIVMSAKVGKGDGAVEAIAPSLQADERF